MKGPFTTEETTKHLKHWICWEQLHHKESDKFKSDEKQLNLKFNEEGFHECQVKIQGHYLIYLLAITSIN